MASTGPGPYPNDTTNETGAGPYPYDDGEEGAAAGGQVDVGVQQVLVHVGVGQQTQFGEHRGHLQVHLVGLRRGEGSEVKGQRSQIHSLSERRETGFVFVWKHV